MTKPLPPDLPKRRSGLISALRNNFLAGLVVIAPIGLTLWLILTVIGWIDGFVWPFVPQAYHPEELINRWFADPAGGQRISINVRGIGVILFFAFTIAVGWVAKGLVGRSFLRWGESLVDRMPVVRSIYNGVKQIAETVFAQSETSFDKACLIEYPRRGSWGIGFISTTAKGEIARRIGVDQEMVTIFIPTTPNPTSGFLLFAPRSEIIELEMSVEDAAKLVISAGLVYPTDRAALAAKLAEEKSAR